MEKAGKQWNIIQQEGIKDVFKRKSEKITNSVYVVNSR